MQRPVHGQQVNSHLHKRPIFYLIHCFTAASVTFCCCEPIEIQLLGLLAVTLDDLQVPCGFCNDGRFSHLLQVQRTPLQAFLQSRPALARVTPRHSDVWLMQPSRQEEASKFELHFYHLAKVAASNRNDPQECNRQMVQPITFSGSWDSLPNGYVR